MTLRATCTLLFTQLYCICRQIALVQKRCWAAALCKIVCVIFTSAITLLIYEMYVRIMLRLLNNQGLNNTQTIEILLFQEYLFELWGKYYIAYTLEMSSVFFTYSVLTLSMTSSTYPKKLLNIIFQTSPYKIQIETRTILECIWQRVLRQVW